MVGTRRAATLVAAAVCSSTAFLLLLPTSAVADNSLVDDVDQALDETVDDATEVVADSVDDVTEVVADSVDDVTVVGESVDDVTSVVADPVSDANGAAATAGGHIGDATNDAVGPINGTEQSGTPASGGQGRESGGGTGPAAGEDREREITRAAGDSERQGRRGATDEWVWNPSDRLELLAGNVPVDAATIVATEGSDDVDPCRDDASLVCLGLLYGIGRYAKAFSNVLGVVATTGVGIVGLAILAFALGTMGSAALAASRTRSGGAVARL